MNTSQLPTRLNAPGPEPNDLVSTTPKVLYSPRRFSRVRDLSVAEVRELLTDHYVLGRIYELKEKLVLEDLAALRKEVNEYIVTHSGLKTIQIVVEDFTFLDLYPGDTAIHYEVYTVRQVVPIP